MKNKESKDFKIPNEVVVIAEEIALEYKGSAADWERFIGLAKKIYNRLILEQKAQENALHAPDD
jgi:hypothetical protein